MPLIAHDMPLGSPHDVSHTSVPHTVAPCRVALFTDTLADVNGVARFICNAAQCAQESGRAFNVLTSTRLLAPTRLPAPNIHNIEPRWSIAMPKYENLQLAWPRTRELHRAADAVAPNVVHVSTPGPVGLAGRRFALQRGLPLVGVYHTDFPAYIERLFESDALTSVTAKVMAWFYRPFARVLTRSEENAHAVSALGIPRWRIVPLRPGIMTQQFGPHMRDESVWAGTTSPGTGTTLRVLYAGRISVEKNLPFLNVVWKRAHAELAERGVRASLCVLGDGPDKQAMSEALDGCNALFPGFLHGPSLAGAYASADIFVFPSTTDTLGQVVMEAQASGLPVLVSDQGGPKEVVKHDETGLVLPANNADAWVQAIVRLAQSTQQRKAMGAAAHQHMQGYTMQACFEHFWQVHEAALGEAHSP